MFHIGRQLERVRILGHEGVGLPLVLDRKHGELSPYFGTKEWDRTRDGRVWVPKRRSALHVAKKAIVEVAARACEHHLDRMGFMPGVTVKGSLQNPAWIIGYNQTANNTTTTFALDSGYIYNTVATDAYAGQFLMGASALTFDTVYFHILSYGGTAANVNDILVELRNAGTNKPGATLHDSVVVNPASATGWIAATGFTSSAVSANTHYWMVVGDPDGNATDFATCTTRIDFGGSMMANLLNGEGYSTTAGWNTAPAAVSNAIAVMVIKFSNGDVLGCPYSAMAAPSSNTNQKGLRIDGLTETLKVFGLCIPQGTSGDLDTGHVYEGSTGPGGSPLGSFALSNRVGNFGGVLGAPVTLAKATEYHLVFKYSTANSVPSKINIGTGTNATLRAAKLGGAGWYFAEANGVTDWANDDINAWPRMGVLIEDQVAVSAGGMRYRNQMSGNVG